MNNSTSLDTLALTKMYLESVYGSSLTSLQKLTTGSISEVYVFSLNNTDKYIARVSSANWSYVKDDYAYTNFNSEIIHIPKILFIGAIGKDLYCCITEYLEHPTLSMVNLTPSVETSFIQSIQQIHSLPAKYITGYGWFDGDKARQKSWQAELDLVQDSRLGWNSTLMKIEPSLYHESIKIIDGLKGYCPENRHIIHGDMNCNNFLVHQDKISTVLDWGNMMIGDFLFDWARHFIRADKPVNKIRKILPVYEVAGYNLSRWQERLYCYMVYIQLQHARHIISISTPARYMSEILLLRKVVAQRSTFGGDYYHY